MKKLVLPLLCILGISAVYAQDEGNPFARYGYEARGASTTIMGRTVLHDRQKVVAIGSVLFDVKADTVAGDFQPDTTVQWMDAQTVSMFIADVGRFNSPDPLAEKYYHISPYAYCNNNSIRYIDPDGREWKTPEDEEYAKKMQQEMTNRVNSEQKSLDKLNAKIAKNQDLGKDVSKDLTKAAGMQTNIDNLKTGVDELTAMGATKDQIFTYNKIDGNVGGAQIDANGVIVMDIANNGSIANGIHESSHGYDFWKTGKPTVNTVISGEVKAYGRQFSFDSSSMPYSDFGKVNSLSDVNARWIMGISSGGNYIYIQLMYPNRNPKDVLKAIK
jgi:RHS repeat-associated protein